MRDSFTSYELVVPLSHVAKLQDVARIASGVVLGAPESQRIASGNTWSVVRPVDRVTSAVLLFTRLEAALPPSRSEVEASSLSPQLRMLMQSGSA